MVLKKKPNISQLNPAHILHHVFP